MSLKVLVVDDTIIYRKIVSDVLAMIPGVQVVGTANNGKIAMNKIAMLKPDFITLDIEMPEMNGLEVLERLNKENSEIGVVMLSTLTQEGGEMTIRALELGAFDFIPKPQSGTMAENLKSVQELLNPIVKAFTRRQDIKNILRGKKPVQSISTGARPVTESSRLKEIKKPALKTDTITKPTPRPFSNSEIITIGISTGGPNALATMIPMLPKKIGVPILIVQHMPPLFTQSLAKSLDTKSAISVKEAEDNEIIQNNTVYIAPGGKQMKIVAAHDGINRRIRITDDPPENSCKPSADYLFRSVSSHYVGRATGVIMTGMGHDGTMGLKLMKRNGAFIIAQDEPTCTVFGMPKEPINKGIVDVISPLQSIASEIVKTVKKSSLL